MNMAQIGRQDGQTTLYVLTGTVPLQEGLYRKPVTKIVEARSMTRGSFSQSGLAGQSVECVPYPGAIQTCPTPGHEKVACGPSGQKKITARHIIREHFPG
jgi:hypothetical protein